MDKIVLLCGYAKILFLNKQSCYMSKFIRLCVLMLCISVNVVAQSKTVTGRIVNEQGENLSGATVSVKNSTVSTQTDAGGNFSLSLPANAKTLVVSHVGMESTEVSIGNKSSFSLTLRSAATTLSDVVAIGYGTVRKTDATGAVQRIGREDLVRDAPTNVLQAMQGKLAGVNVTQNDGAPGAGLSIKVRGSNSFLGGTEPLYVIDGVPFNNGNSMGTPASIGGDEKQTINVLSFLNPADIESIDILKDASATAIYGSRGANGVVLINTKKGKVGQSRGFLTITWPKLFGQKDHKNKKATFERKWLWPSSGSWTRTSDLWVMSPTSYQLLHPAVSLNWSANIQQMFYRKQLFL